MSEILNKLYRVVKIICQLFLIAEICITSMAVAGRYIPFIPDPAWSEELTLTCMIYMAFIGASLAVRKKTHIRMTSLDRYMPVKLVQAIEIFDDLLVLIFSLMTVIEGFPYAINAGKAVYVSLPALSRFWLYAPVPFAGVAMSIFQLEGLVKDVRVFLAKEAKEVGQ